MEAGIKMIGNGLTLIDTWLKESKKCQVTLKNWNVTSRYCELHNEDTIIEVMDSMKDFFYDRYNINIFRDRVSPFQFLSHGEIDVLGLEIKSGTIANIYGVTTVFLDMGFTYLQDNIKIERIIRNMIRTSMLIYGYYDISKGTIIYAGSKLKTSVQEQLKDAVKVLNEIFKVYGFQFTFIYSLNEEFQSEIHTPKKNENTPGTTLPLDNIVNVSGRNMVSGITQQYLRKVSVSEDNVKIGLMVRNEVAKLSKNGQISEELVQCLLDEEYSKETFNLNYPLLKKILKSKPITDQRYVNGYPRYWLQVFFINGDRYLICNDWYEHHRTKFLEWLELR